MSLFGNFKDSINLDDQGDMDSAFYSSDALGGDGGHYSAFGGNLSQFGASQQMMNQRPSTGSLMGLAQSSHLQHSQQQQQNGLSRPHSAMQQQQQQQQANARPTSGLGMPTANSILSGLSRFNNNSVGNFQDDFHLDASDDFPALPTAGLSSHHMSSNNNNNNSSNSNSQSVLNGLLGRELGVVGEKSSRSASTIDGSNISAASSSTTTGSSTAPPGLLANLSSLLPAQSTSATTLSKEMKFGLAGLLELIRGTDKDSYSLSLGLDPTQFGLNLNNADILYPTFSSPFVENAQDEPALKIPQCYTTVPTPKLDHFAKYQLETLFYMFYMMPRDIFQSLAAQELYKRDWRFHSELKVWLKPRSQQEMLTAHPNVQFLYFDAKTFEARLFSSVNRGNLLAGILSEEDIRVKIGAVNGSAGLNEST